MPTKVWAVGEEVLAADFNTYVQQQVVASFANLSALQAGWPDAPIGAQAVVTDTALVYTHRAAGGAGWVANNPIYDTVAALKADTVSRRALVKLTTPPVGYVQAVRIDAGDYGGPGWRVEYTYQWTFTVAGGSGQASGGLTAAMAGITTFLGAIPAIYYGTTFGTSVQLVSGGKIPGAPNPHIGPINFRFMAVSAGGVVSYLADTSQVWTTVHVIGVL